MAHILAIQQFHSHWDISKWLDLCIASKKERLYRHYIQSLPTKCKHLGQRWAIFWKIHLQPFYLNIVAFSSKDTENLVELLILKCFKTHLKCFGFELVREVVGWDRVHFEIISITFSLIVRLKIFNETVVTMICNLSMEERRCFKLFCRKL